VQAALPLVDLFRGSVQAAIYDIHGNLPGDVAHGPMARKSSRFFRNWRSPSITSRELAIVKFSLASEERRRPGIATRLTVSMRLASVTCCLLAIFSREDVNWLADGPECRWHRVAPTAPVAPFALTSDSLLAPTP
jgi:hypothetical protein